jgi:aromatic ring-opening dioxygenase LigB subunit
MMMVDRKQYVVPHGDEFITREADLSRGMTEN